MSAGRDERTVGLVDGEAGEAASQAGARAWGVGVRVRARARVGVGVTG